MHEELLTCIAGQIVFNYLAISTGAHSINGLPVGPLKRCMVTRVLLLDCKSS